MIADQIRSIDDAQISLTDPDSSAMAAHSRVAVNAKHKLIVEQHVVNQVLDMDSMQQQPERHAMFWASRTPFSASANSATTPREAFMFGLVV